MRHLSLVPVAASFGLFASIPLTIQLAGAGPAGPGPTMAVSEIKAGMKGYGLTVFRGTEPERFAVEVLGTIHRFRPNQDLVLIRTSHPRLEVAKVVAGMSGSPVYIDGRMIGAYAYGWQFGAEPIAGVTPIRSMLDEAARPLPIMRPLPSNAADTVAGDALRGTSFGGDVGAYDLREHARQLAARSNVMTESTGPRLSPVATPILLGGLGEGATKLARELLEPMGLEPVQGGGAGIGGESEGPTAFVDGGAIAVQLVRGDVSAMGLGTVTRVDGDRLVAFGHPMMNAGASALPTATARVLWVLASQARSFKLGEPLRPLGALVNDRPAAIVVDSKSPAPVFPATVEIDGVPGATHKLWSFTVAHEKFMSPSFLAMAVGSAIETTTSEHQDVTWRATTDVAVTGLGTIRLEDAGVSVGGTPDSDDWARSRAVRAVGALLNNPWEATRIEKVATHISVRFARETYRLRGVDVLAEVIDAGQPARLRLHLIPFAGPEEIKVIEVPVPSELAGREVEIELAPGYGETPDLPSPERLSELAANLPRQSYPIDSVVASIKMPEHGVAFHGQVATRLPPGALDALRPSSDTRAPEPFISYVRIAIPIHRFLDGRDRVHVRIRAVLR